MLDKLLLVALATFVLNVPFGWLRGGVPKFSIPWFVFIHVPVPLVILMRIKSGIGFAWYTYPVVLAAFFAGQFLGVKLRRWRLAAAE